MNPFKQLMQAAQARGPSHAAPVGTWIMSASPIVAEATGYAGFEWAVVDMEHTPLDLMDVVHLLQAVGNTPMLPVLRVPWNDTVMIKRVLDAGAKTLLVPFVQNADEAARAVAATRYAPEGVRGMAGMSRGSQFGTAPNYLKVAHHSLSVIVQLETPAALAQLEAIAAVPGVDAIFMGPADLSASMGYTGELTHPEVMKAMADAARRCKAVGIPVGTVGGTVELVEQYRAMGYTYLAIASDLGLYMRGAQAAAQALKGAGTAAASSKPAGY